GDRAGPEQVRNLLVTADAKREQAFAVLALEDLRTNPEVARTSEEQRSVGSLTYPGMLSERRDLLHRPVAMTHIDVRSGEVRRDAFDLRLAVGLRRRLVARDLGVQQRGQDLAAGLIAGPAVE